MSTNGDSHEARFHGLLEFLSRVPAVVTDKSPFRGFGTGGNVDGAWWIKLAIDINHPLAWSAVQELGHVLNYISPSERLPTVFMPISPPPYLNGGPEFLSWVIECHVADFPPDMARDYLEARLPKPVDDPAQWPANQSDANSDPSRSNGL